MFLRSLLNVILMAACLAPSTSLWSMDFREQTQEGLSAFQGRDKDRKDEKEHCGAQAQQESMSAAIPRAGDDLHMFGTQLVMFPHNYSVPYKALQAYSKTFRERFSDDRIVAHMASSQWTSLLPLFLKQNPWRVDRRAKIDLFVKLERQAVKNTKALYYLAKYVPEIGRYYFDSVRNNCDEKHRMENPMVQDASGRTILEHAIIADDAQFVASYKKMCKASSEPANEKSLCEHITALSLKHNAVRTLWSAMPSDHAKADSVVLTEFVESRAGLTLPEVTTYYNALKMKKKQQAALAQAHQKTLARGTLGNALVVDLQNMVRGYLQSAEHLKPHRMSQKLQNAIEKGDLATLKICIAQGHSLAACTPDYMNALELATYHDRIDIFKELIQHLPYINEQKQRVLLTYAHNDAMRHVIQKELPEYTAQKNAELLQASDIVFKPTDILRALRKGANPNVSNAHGSTRLEDAVDWKQPAILKILLEHGADKNNKDQDGNTPMHDAASNNRPECLRVLLEHGADKNNKNRYGDTPMHDAASNNRPECLRILLEHGADKNNKNQDGNTPMHDAVSRNHPECLRILLEYGADKNSKNQYDNTPIYLAVLHNHPECLRLLLEYGADKNVKGSYGYTPMHGAASNNHPECLRVLLEYGADHSIKNGIGYTPMDDAAIHNKSECFKILKEYGAQLTLWGMSRLKLPFLEQY